MIVDYNELDKITERTTFVIGTYDILHAGHVYFLDQAKKAGGGNKLLVGIIPDSVVRARKGLDRPVNHEADRVVIVDALSVVDYVFLAPELPMSEAVAAVLRTVKPEYSVASRGDYENRSEEWHTEGTEMILIDKILERSTTNIVQKIRS